MKKKGFTILLAALTISAAAGGSVYVAERARSVRAESVSSSDLAVSDQEGKSFDRMESDGSESSLDLLAASLPSGSIAKTDLEDISDEEMKRTGVADVSSDVMPALVSITTTTIQNVQSWFRGGNFQIENQYAGTGVIMGQNEDELLIVTNNHVVEGAKDLTVSFVDEESVSGVIKGTDPDNDLAVVSVQVSDIGRKTLKEIRVANTGDSDDLVVGEQVVAIGNALGYGQSVTTGIVSALNRTISGTDGSVTTKYENLIQTDAAINPGNSGGALVNMKGEVIGINVAKSGLSTVEGMGYAIPTSKALPIIQKLMNQKTRTKVDESEAAYIGFSGQDITPQVMMLYNVPQGIYVTDVAEDSPAEKAGLEVDMIITGFDGHTISDMDDLRSILEYYAGGETVKLSVAVQNRYGYVNDELELTLGLKRDYLNEGAAYGEDS